MNKLWQKNHVSLHPLIEKYTVGSDYLFDQELITYDIEATAAHAAGLQKIGIINEDELVKITYNLNRLKQKIEQGKIKITIQDEDCHTIIENYLINKLGDLGKKIHTGRSRNDQILVALRLYMKDILKKTNHKTIQLAKLFLKLAKNYKNIPLPGYTHSQQAMLSSLGHYYGSFVESLLDDAQIIKNTHDHINKNPLGSAAGYGVSIPLDREFTTHKLGFKKIQINSLYCQNSRGKFESLFLESLCQVMLTLTKFANDLLLFTTKEFDFFTIDEQLVTGSSIMPQKKNLDAMEILRGNSSVLMSYQDIIKNIAKNTISGYNRDLQLIKKPLIEGSKILLESLDIVEIYLNGMQPKVKSIEQKIKKEIFTADIANQMVVEKKIPFRDAYKLSLNELPGKTIDIEQNLKSKVSLGAPGNLNLSYYEHKINKLLS